MKAETRSYARNFTGANLRRQVEAAAATCARVRRALEILGPDAPDVLAEAGRLRLRYKRMSLAELGELMTPPLSKDAVAGRIRRLLDQADRRAQQMSIPDTQSGTAGGP